MQLNHAEDMVNSGLEKHADWDSAGFNVPLNTL